MRILDPIEVAVERVLPQQVNKASRQQCEQDVRHHNLDELATHKTHDKLTTHKTHDKLTTHKTHTFGPSSSWRSLGLLL